jgi:hypothetical protein
MRPPSRTADPDLNLRPPPPRRHRFFPGKYMAPGMFHVVEQLVGRRAAGAAPRAVAAGSRRGLQAAAGAPCQKLTLRILPPSPPSTRPAPTPQPGLVESADLTNMLARGYWCGTSPWGIWTASRALPPAPTQAESTQLTPSLPPHNPLATAPPPPAQAQLQRGLLPKGLQPLGLPRVPGRQEAQGHTVRAAKGLAEVPGARPGSGQGCGCGGCAPPQMRRLAPLFAPHPDPPALNL